MNQQRLAMICGCDLSGQLRGQAIPLAQGEPPPQSGLPWPAHHNSINAFDQPVPLAWDRGPEWRLRPDLTTGTPLGPDLVTERKGFFLADLVLADGTAAPGCARQLVRDALGDMKDEFGLDLTCAFEHSFHVDSGRRRAGPALGPNSFRQHYEFLETLGLLLREAGVSPQSLGPGWAPDQVKVLVSGLPGLKAIDQALMFRELARSGGEHHGLQTSFSPLPYPGAPINGLTIKFSLSDQGDQMSYDRSEPFGISKTLGAFLAGIIRALPAISAVTMASPLAHLARQSDQRAPQWADLGLYGPGSAVRLVAISHDRGQAPRAGQDGGFREYQLEFDLADATANPYLQVAVIVRAGLEGLREALRAPVIEEGYGPPDPQVLPETMAVALDSLEVAAAEHDWLPATTLGAYLAIKRAEVAATQDLDLEALCAQGRQTY